MRGVRRESLLFRNVRFQPREHRVEAVSELAELVVVTVQLDSMGQRTGRGQAGGVRNAAQRSKHAAGEQPASEQAEEQQERHHAGRERGEVTQEVGVTADHEDHTGVDAS